MMTPDTIVNMHVWGKLKVVPENPPTPETDAEEALSAMVGGMALLQPLQQDLFALESDAEVLLSLRESAKILFDINRVAVLLYTPNDDKLSGASICGQPAIFRQIDIPLGDSRSIVALAAQRREIRSTFDCSEQPQISLLDVQFSRAFASPGLLCIPMITRNKVLGVMICGLSQSLYSRLSRRLPWLLNFGRIAAISLETFQEAKNYRANAEEIASKQFMNRARRVVHEAGNPLGIIKSYLKILDRKLPEETGVRQELEILTEEIDRVAGIVGRMNEIPKEDTDAFGVNIGDLIGELLLLYQAPLFEVKGIHFEISLPAEPMRVRCEKNSLKQILLNLWKNAAEALSGGQQIKVILTDHVIHNGSAFIQLRMDDNGPGMSEQQMRSIHGTPANLSNNGRGMGLSIVGELASRQGIPITCRSQPGKGTSIALLLPKFADEIVPADSGINMQLSGMDEK
jgi:nitrogen-specific signal transduction histidine kinase